MDLLLPLLVDGICTGSRYAILGMGFALIFNTQRMFDISFGGIYTWCGLAMWMLAAYVGLGIPVAGALVLGLWFLYSGVRVAVDRTVLRARAVLLASVLYLPLIYGLMLIDRPGL